MTRMDKVRTVGEIVPPEQDPKTDEDSNATWSLCHRVITSSRTNRTKKQNTLLKQIADETPMLENSPEWIRMTWRDLLKL